MAAAASLSGGSAMDVVKLRKEALDLLLVPLLDKTARRSCHGYADLPDLVPAPTKEKQKAAEEAAMAMGSEAPDETSSTGSFDGFSSDVNNGVDSFISGPMSPENSSSRASAQWDAEISDSNASVYASPSPWPLDRARSDNAIALASSSSAAASSAPSPSPAAADLLLPRTGGGGGDGGCAGASSGYGLPSIINSQGSKGLILWDDMAPPDRCSAIADRCKDMADASEAETMKERFAKLLLGEDLSGGGKGVSTALAVSNAITNLSAAIFGELWQLEPLADATKERWRKEMERLLSVSDYIVEFVPCSKSLADGSTMKVMDTKPRLDLHICLPALRKLDAMLIEGLDSFVGTEFWYVADRSLLQSSRAQESQALQAAMARSSSRSNGSSASDGGGGGSSCINRWWLPAPMVPADGGLSGAARKHLQQQRESVNQILKAAMAVNAQVLAEMMVPAAFTDALPKNGRSSLGEVLYREMSAEGFCASEFIAGFDAGRDEHAIVDLMNSVEAALHVWRRKLVNHGDRSHGSSELGECHSHGGNGWHQGIRALRRLPKKDAPERRQMLMERAESLLLLLRLKFPGLPQSILDVSKIQYCKDVGQSILESYSRVLESLAYNVRSRIDDVLHADDAAKCQSQSQNQLQNNCQSQSQIQSQIQNQHQNNCQSQSQNNCQIQNQHQNKCQCQSQIQYQHQSKCQCQSQNRNQHQHRCQSPIPTPKAFDPPLHHRHWLRHPHRHHHQ